MFEDCKTMSELNQARISALRDKSPAVLVNKEYAKRKALLISGENRDFKRIKFVPVPILESEFVTGIDFAYEDGNTICISTRLLNG